VREDHAFLRQSSGSYEQVLAALASARPDDGAAAATTELLDRLTKPPGSLGRLETLAVQLSRISGVSPPPVPAPAMVAVFAGDHGVLAEGVSPWPQEVTAQMVANFCAGGAAINVLARHVGASVVVVDVGVATPLPPFAPAVSGEDGDGEGRTLSLIEARVASGTANLLTGPAMTPAQCRAALDVGASTAMRLVAAGARCLVTGDMGIANTTPSAALIAAFTGCPAAKVTGRGTGIDDERLARKTAVVAAAVERADPSHLSPEAVLAELGGLEIAALAGFITAGAAARVPVALDGVIAAAAVLAAHAMAGSAGEALLDSCIAGHRSVEPGAAVVLEHLGLAPVLELDMRLGEGTGACLAVPVLQAAAKICAEMATFDSAGVSRK